MSINQVVFITGSSSGFGELTSLTLAKQGYTVVSSMRDIEGKNRKKKEEFEWIRQQEQVDLHVVEVDVTQDQSVKNGVDQVIEQFGRIDVVVNNAGIMPSGITEGYSVEQVKRLMDTNFYGSIRVNQAVLPYMREKRKGLFIQVSSIAGGLVWPFYSFYCASKAAVEALAEGYNYELSSFGIDSVILEPGHFPTNLLDSQEAPENQAVVKQYGAVVEIEKELMKKTVQILQGEDAQDPQIVADEIVQLIQMPQGKRPFRTIPGRIELGLAKLNEAKIEAQRSAIQAVGLEKLAPSLFSS